MVDSPRIGREAMQLDDVQTVHDGHVHVDQHDVERARFECVQRLPAIVDQSDRMAGAAQHSFDHLLIDAVVLRDQHAQRRPAGRVMPRHRQRNVRLREGGVQGREQRCVVDLGGQDRQIPGVIILLPRRHQHDAGRVRLGRDTILERRQIEWPFLQIDEQERPVAGRRAP